MFSCECPEINILILNFTEAASDMASCSKSYITVEVLAAFQERYVEDLFLKYWFFGLVLWKA